MRAADERMGARLARTFTRGSSRRRFRRCSATPASRCRSSTSTGFRLRYDSLGALVRDLRAMGATNVLASRSTRPLVARCGRSRGAAIRVERGRRADDRDVRNPPFRGLDAADALEWMKRALTSAPHQLLTRRSVNRPRGRGPEEGGVDAIRTNLRRCSPTRSGATAIEYGLIAALIAVAMMGGTRSAWRRRRRHVDERRRGGSELVTG